MSKSREAVDRMLSAFGKSVTSSGDELPKTADMASVLGSAMDSLVQQKGVEATAKAVASILNEPATPPQNSIADGLQAMKAMGFDLSGASQAMNTSNQALLGIINKTASENEGLRNQNAESQKTILAMALQNMSVENKHMISEIAKMVQDNTKGAAQPSLVNQMLEQKAASVIGQAIDAYMLGGQQPKPTEPQPQVNPVEQVISMIDGYGKLKEFVQERFGITGASTLPAQASGNVEVLKVLLENERENAKATREEKRFEKEIEVKQQTYGTFAQVFNRFADVAGPLVDKFLKDMGSRQLAPIPTGQVTPRASLADMMQKAGAEVPAFKPPTKISSREI